jgi:hypothetical protein
MYFESANVNSLFLEFINTFGYNNKRVAQLVKQLKSYSDWDQAEMLQQSLDRGWKCLYEVRK